MSKLLISDVATSSGRYKDRAQKVTPEIQKNMQELCQRVSALLADLGWVGKLDVVSGYRTPEANAATSNAGAKSRHLLGAACDILDDSNQTLAKLVQSREDLLIKHDLYTEHLSKTVGKRTNWVHLEIIGPKSKKRIFMP